VTDFNLSKVIEETTPGSVTTMGGGDNPRWLAPEVLEGAGAGAAGDVFAYGVVLWELLTWKFPWQGLSTWAIVGKVVSGARLRVPPAGALPALGDERRGLDAYVALMEQCWAHRPAERPTFAQVVRALREL
jgi:serine/threonine protein kinase